MADNQSFIERTNFLKNEKKFNFSVQSEKLHIERHVFDSYRANRVSVPEHIERRLATEFPEITDFEENTEMRKPNEDTVHEPMVMYSDGNAWKEAYNTQKKLVDMQARELEALRKEVEQLRGENKALKDIFRQREKKS